MFRRVCLIGLLALLTACSSLTGLKAPNATVRAVRVVPSNGLLPDFAIDLHLTNPNDRDLTLRGASYTLSLGSHEVVSGVANKLPVLPAYGQADVTLTATPDISGALGLVQKLMQGNKKAMHYRLEARFDLAAVLPDLVITKEGDLTDFLGHAR